MDIQKRKYKVPAVEKMLAIVEFLSNEPEPFTISELAKKLDTSKNMVFRIVKYLEQQNYLESDSSHGCGLSPVGLLFSFEYRNKTALPLQCHGQVYSCLYGEGRNQQNHSSTVVRTHPEGAPHKSGVDETSGSSQRIRVGI